MFLTLLFVGYSIVMHLVFIWLIEILMRPTPNFAGRALQVLFTADILLLVVLGVATVNGFSLHQFLMMMR